MRPNSSAWRYPGAEASPALSTPKKCQERLGIVLHELGVLVVHRWPSGQHGDDERRPHRDSRRTVRGDVPTASWRRRNETQVRRSRALIFCRSACRSRRGTRLRGRLRGPRCSPPRMLPRPSRAHQRIRRPTRAANRPPPSRSAHPEAPRMTPPAIGPPKRISTTRSAFASISRTWSTATRCPARMIATRSTARCTSASTCEERNTVAPSARTSRNNERNSRCMIGSRPLVGSSNTSKLRAMHERLNNSELLPVPSRQRPDRLRQVTAEPFGELLAVGDVVTTTQMHQIGQHLHAGQLVVQGKIPGQIPDAPPQPRTRTPRIRPQHLHRPGRRTQQIDQHADRRRLPRTIRSEKAKHLTRLHLERQPIDRQRRTETLRHLIATHRGRHPQSMTCEPQPIRERHPNGLRAPVWHAHIADPE